MKSPEYLYHEPVCDTQQELLQKQRQYIFINTTPPIPDELERRKLAYDPVQRVFFSLALLRTVHQHHRVSYLKNAG